MEHHSDEVLREEYGPDAIFTRVGDILIVHLDKPTESMIRQRITEIQREAREPVDDCPLCEETRLAGGYTVVYQGNLLPEEN
ncbi:MAG: hypothetical protein HY594_05125 [Candidatus Omnitrophica bacterium]|nr:hypothetical protein [Candidatus Omnitrophota bacterium]